jgi:D-glycero-alpha-D-manno-heptose 1-phosphate guanylyltransferase
MNTRVTREALILAGGAGTRLRSVVGDRPKPLADILGRPFIERLLGQLQRFRYERAILCVGYGADQVRARLGERFGTLELAYSFEDRPLGTAGALRNAIAMVEAEHVMAMNGDSYCDLDLTAFAAAHPRFGGEATMAVLRLEDCRAAGVVELDADNRIIAFASRPAQPGPGLINSGIYLFRREALLAVPEGRAVSLEDEVFPQLAAKRTLFAWPCSSDFIDIGTPESYASAQTFFVKQ